MVMADLVLVSSILVSCFAGGFVIGYGIYTVRRGVLAATR